MEMDFQKTYVFFNLIIQNNTIASIHLRNQINNFPTASYTFAHEIIYKLQHPPYNQNEWKRIIKQATIISWSKASNKHIHTTKTPNSTHHNFIHISFLTLSDTQFRLPNNTFLTNLQQTHLHLLRSILLHSNKILNNLKTFPFCHNTHLNLIPHIFTNCPSITTQQSNLWHRQTLTLASFPKAIRYP